MCFDELVHCPEGTLPNEDCLCTEADAGAAPSRLCDMFIMCTDGGQPDENCQCTEGELEFLPEIPGGGGPLPRPNHR